MLPTVAPFTTVAIHRVNLVLYLPWLFYVLLVQTQLLTPVFQHLLASETYPGQSLVRRVTIRGSEMNK